jgi:hypothetical protein
MPKNHFADDAATYIDELKAEIDRLREALESAPEPATRPPSFRGPYYEHPGREPADEDYASWYDGTREEALR